MEKISPHHFWRWFQLNQEYYLLLNQHYKADTDYWMTELSTHLKACCHHASADLHHCSSSGKGRLIFRLTDRSDSQQLELLASMAPELSNWYVMISREMPNPQKPDISRLYCTLVEQVDDTGRYGLLVYVMQDEEVPEEMKIAVEEMVRQLLAPHHLMAALAAIAVENIKEVPAGDQLMKLEQLPASLRQ